MPTGVSAALAKRVGVPRLLVGSKATQPMPSKYTSGHACNWLVVTCDTGSPSTDSPVRSPGRKPTTMREGMSRARAMSANAPAKP